MAFPVAEVDGAFGELQRHLAVALPMRRVTANTSTASADWNAAKMRCGARDATCSSRRGARARPRRSSGASSSAVVRTTTPSEHSRATTSTKNSTANERIISSTICSGCAATVSRPSESVGSTAAVGVSATASCSTRVPAALKGRVEKSRSSSPSCGME